MRQYDNGWKTRVTSKWVGTTTKREARDCHCEQSEAISLKGGLGDEIAS
jgi:hypothetical protein